MFHTQIPGHRLGLAYIRGFISLRPCKTTPSQRAMSATATSSSYNEPSYGHATFTALRGRPLRFIGGITLAKSKLTVQERLMAYISVDPVTGCWLWQKRRDRDGYGRFKVDCKVQGAHRVSYELFVGPIPDGLPLDHLCRTRHCVNPAHLEPVTVRENTLRSPLAITALNVLKTHCPAGHPYDDDNTYRADGGIRSCRACGRVKQRAYRQRKQQRLAAAIEQCN